MGTPEGDAIVAAALARLQRPLARLESHLAAADWLVAGRFTVADILMEETLRYAAVAPGLFDALPRTKVWFDRCRARPAFQKMWALREAE